VSLGVDVSTYQPVIDWRQLRIDGRVFAYAKCCDGLALDLCHPKHIVGARAANILAGSYQFGHPSMDVNACAHFFLQHCDLTELRPAIDMESLALGLVPSNAGIWADQWCEIVKAAMLALGTRGAGRGPLIYASTSYWATMRAQHLDVGGWDWWAAEYHGDNDPNGHAPAGSAAWQYAGNVPLRGQVELWDLDVTSDLDLLCI
jgi:GH25 family lysozyme M1 (1,4-beta-N-acetylmuramidase)